MARRTPIYWSFLVHNKLRLAMSLSGIGFAVLAMFMEVGFFNGLNDSQAILAPAFRADLVMMNRKKVHLNRWEKFYRGNLYQAFSHEEVAQVIPIYEGQLLLKNPQTGLHNAITVLAYPAGSDPFSIAGLDLGEGGLKNSALVMYDRRSRAIYGRIAPGDTVEMGGVKYTVGGLVELGPSFSRNGYVFMNAAAWHRNHEPGQEHRLSFGFIRLRPGADAAAVQRSLRAELDKDVDVLTPAQIIQREFAFTTYYTPIGVIFGLGLVVGFVIGVIICYQILFNEITDHLPQYATLKAVGYSDRYLVGIVLKAAMVLSVLGFIPGLLAAAGFYELIEANTRILMALNPLRVGLVFILTVLMCLAAGFLAVRKVVQADPAELF